VLKRQLSQARSKPNPVDRVRTAHYIDVHTMCTIMMHNSTELSNNLPSYLPGNHQSSDVVWWRGGEHQITPHICYVMWLIETDHCHTFLLPCKLVFLFHFCISLCSMFCNSYCYYTF